MKNILNSCILLFSVFVLFTSCEKEINPLLVDTDIVESKKALKMAFGTSLGVGTYPDCPIGAGGCAAPAITIDWVVLTKAIEYVEEEAPDHVVAGIEILNRKTVRYHLLHQGNDYANADHRPGGSFHVVEYGVIFPATLSRTLGVNSITLLGGEYQIQKSKDKAWSGYVDIKARIR